MKWIAYCKTCESFLAQSGPKQMAALGSARRHSRKEGHLVAIGLSSYMGKRFIFTTLRLVRYPKRPAKMWRQSGSYLNLPAQWRQMRLFNNEEDKGNG
jgi:hypothetical protein